jgi:hypothetical protein
MKLGFRISEDGFERVLRNIQNILLLSLIRIYFRLNSFATSAKKGVEKARKGGFAYITEEPILEYYNSISPCNTMLVKQLLEAKSYGFALTKNSELTNKLSVNILKVSRSLLYTCVFVRSPGDLTVIKRTGTSNRIEIQFRTFNHLSRPDSSV